MLPSACGLGQHFQDLGHSFSLYGPPSRQITYNIGPRSWQYGPSAARSVQNDEGQYFPVRLELARLVSSLLYGTLGWSMLVCFLLRRTSAVHLNSKGFLRVFLMTRATKKEQATTNEFENKFNHRWPKLDIWVALCGPLHCYVTRAICIFIKICMGKEINPKKNEKLPLNYNKNRLPEFQLRFLCVLCDFLTDLERFSVV